MSNFSKIVRTCTVLIFFLSVSVLDLQASEAGVEPLFGTQFVLNEQEQGNSAITPAALKRPTVAGISVQAALDSTSTTTATSTATSTPPATPPTPTTTPTTTSPFRGLERAIDNNERRRLAGKVNKGQERSREVLERNLARKSGRSATSTATSTISLFSRADRIEELKKRIARLKYQLTQLELDVIQREKLRERAENHQLIGRLKGRILLQVHENGEAWYVDPNTNQKFYLKDGTAAYQALKAFGLGITNADLEKIPIGETATTSTALSVQPRVDTILIKRLKGKILLQTESHGEAWYVHPVNGKRYYLKDGTSAYEIMRRLSLGVDNDNVSQIPTGSLATD